MDRPTSLHERYADSTYNAAHRAENISGLIQHVETNPLAANLLDRNHKYLATATWLSEHAFLASPKDSPGEVSFFTPTQYTRSFAVLRLNPLTEVISWKTTWKPSSTGNCVTTKGNLATGGDWENGYGRNMIADDPWGYFGKKDAQLDMRLSNSLIRSGANVALPLGFIELNSDVLQNQMHRYSTMHQKQLSTIRANGDIPVIYFRVTSGIARVEDYFHTRKAPEIRQGLQEAAGIVYASTKKDKSLYELAMGNWQSEIHVDQAIHVLEQNLSSTLKKSIPAITKLAHQTHYAVYPALKDILFTGQILDFESASPNPLPEKFSSSYAEQTFSELCAIAKSG